RADEGRTGRPDRVPQVAVVRVRSEGTVAAEVAPLLVGSPREEDPSLPELPSDGSFLQLSPRSHALVRPRTRRRVAALLVVGLEPLCSLLQRPIPRGHLSQAGVAARQLDPEQARASHVYDRDQSEWLAHRTSPVPDAEGTSSATPGAEHE